MKLYGFIYSFAGYFKKHKHNVVGMAWQNALFGISYVCNEPDEIKYYDDY